MALVSRVPALILLSALLSRREWTSIMMRFALSRVPSNSETHSLDGLRALRKNLADGFWGNGMRLALAEKAGITSCISSYAAATVRQTRGIAILPR